MSNDRYTRLCERIVAHCRERNWYGPDTPLPGEEDEYYEDGVFHVHHPLHDLHSGFAFPPATEEQLARTEEVMGFAHPPLLRALYLQVANGGFGPGTGIIGAFGGYCTDRKHDPRYLPMQKAHLLKEYGEAFCMESYPNRFNPITFDLEQHEKREGDGGPFLLSTGAWPLSFLQLCGAWYGDAYCLHAPSDRVYAVWAEMELWRVADSLAEWLERWLEGGIEAHF